MKLSLTVVDFVILSLVLQGLILCVLLFFSSKKINSNRWLAIFVFVVSYSAMITEIIIARLPDKYPMLIVEIPRLRMLLGPLLLFYTSSLLYGDKKLSRKDYSHFLALLIEMGPQIFFVLYFSHLIQLPVVQNIIQLKVVNFYFYGNGFFTEFPFLLSVVIYAVISYKMVTDNQISQDGSLHKARDIKWLKSILYTIFTLIATRAVFIIIGSLAGGDMTDWAVLTMVLLTMVFIYGLGMAAYIRQNKMSSVEATEYNKPPVKIYFSDTEAEQYHRKLISLMEERQFYLNPALKLDVLTDELSVSERVISNVLNQYIGKNFNDFINEYRVLEAKKRLADPSLAQFTIASIAFDCGFNSLATFQRCFKQFTGITPSQYQNSLKPNLSIQK